MNMTRPVFALIAITVCFAGCSDSGSSPPPTTSTAPVAADNVATKSQTETVDPPVVPFVAPPLSDDEIRDGWISLFDGASLFGWKPNSDTNWRVEDGVITADGDATGLLISSCQFDDYEFRCDFRLASGGNSGIFLRTPTEPSNPAIDCYELNICDTHESFPTGALVALTRAETTHTVEGDWHSYHVTLDGPAMTVRLDGDVILEYTDDTESPLATGHIGLQMNGGRVEFRNVTLRPLGTEPLFNGTDLSGWREVPGSASEFTVVDNAIHVVDGRGFLETETTWQDFVLQADIRTNGDRLNSGIFFRAIPGTESNPSDGYEYQVQNGFNNDDRTQPADWGTGAIFKRVAARRVVADDGDWLTATLIAQGAHIATWVNGYQVVDWVDEREPSDNPRQGLRREGGHISLQGHDPTTDLDFRNFRISETPLR